MPEAVSAGELMVSRTSVNEHALDGADHDWPGRRQGLKEREAEILALITQGRQNAEIAALVYLSENTVKSYVRQLYRKIGVRSRTQAVLWGSRNGFLPDHRSTAGAAADDPHRSQHDISETFDGLH